MKKNILLLSHIITQEIPSYGNRDFVRIEKKSSIVTGDTSNTSSWIFSNNHIGTHIDTPYHFFEDGKRTYNYPLDDFFFDNVGLIDIPCRQGILIKPKEFQDTKKEFAKDLELLLIRTGYEQYRLEEKYWNDNPGLAPELADYLRDCYPNLRCIGFDFISLSSWNYQESGRESHRRFLCPIDVKKEILVIEDMALSKIYAPIKKVIVAPLFVVGGDGGAVTVFAEIELEGLHEKHNLKTKITK